MSCLSAAAISGGAPQANRSGTVSGVSVRSAGTSRNARRRLTLADVRWADLILVMEEKHKSRLRADFRDEVKDKELHVLDISDDYRFMDPELVEIIREKTEPLILGREIGD